MRARFSEPYLIHKLNGVSYKTKISTLRGDYQKTRWNNRQPLRLWEKHDFKPRPDDIFQERLYCVQWMRPKKKGKGDEYEFRSVTPEDLERERDRRRRSSRSIWPTGRQGLGAGHADRSRAGHHGIRGLT